MSSPPTPIPHEPETALPLQPQVQPLFPTNPGGGPLAAPPWVEDFCWRIEQQVGEGGFALTLGDPGTGKSAALRLLVERLSPLRDVTVGVLTRPQASLAAMPYRNSVTQWRY